MICFPNAKINLGLSILEKRNDGYHNISTIMIPVPVYDIIEVRKSDSFIITQYGQCKEIQQNENTIHKIWKILESRFSGITPLEVVLFKNIPEGSGLGGGSADASFFLKLVNNYHRLGLNIKEMEEIGEQVGADCPFFIKNTTAIAQGKGSLLNQIPNPLNGYCITIVCPDIHISTKEAYSKIMTFGSEIDIGILKNDVSTWRTEIVNDFESEILKEYPELGTIKSALYNNGALYTSMTGTGSSIFSVSEKVIKTDQLFPHYRTFQFFL